MKFRLRVTLAFIIAAAALAIISNVLNYNLTYKSEFENQRTLLIQLAKNAVLMIDPHEVHQIPLTKEGLSTQSYFVVTGELKRIKAANPQIKDIYILAPSVTRDSWKFIADLDEISPNGTTIPASEPGTKYDAGRFSEMVEGLNRPTADLKLETDEYGTTLSGYAPLRDESGAPFAVLGIDSDANYIYAIKNKLLQESIALFLIGVILAFFISIFLSGKVVEPLKKLKDGIQRIKDGHWDSKVEVLSKDEIGGLAVSFNEMAQSLEHYRQLLKSYFFDSVKALALLLEARDPYTHGHSQSVANYSEMIALRMGIDPKFVEYFKNIVLLHDIGKVGVRDNVLNKPDKLTDEEFDLIKRHAQMGEEILKPILDDPLMLSVVRNHHERFDGKGYPDGMNKDKIPLLVSIVTVADSYDAMTSNRAYRKGMDREVAIGKLLEGCGTQFHPEVVDTFVKILREQEA